jgi:hypothetical protein
VKQLHLLLRAIAHKKPQRKELKPGARERGQKRQISKLIFDRRTQKVFLPE